MTADLEGFNLTLGYIADLSRREKRLTIENPHRTQGYLIHARALLLDARSRDRHLSLSGQKTLEGLLRGTDRFLHTPSNGYHTEPDIHSMSQKTLPLLLELSRSTDETLQAAQKANREIVSLQVTGFVLFLALTSLLLAWLERYRRFLRNLAIYEALNVSSSGIAFLTISMDRFLVVNKGFEELFGFPSEEVCQKPAPPVDTFFGRPDLLHDIGDLIQGRQRFLPRTEE